MRDATTKWLEKSRWTVTEQSVHDGNDKIWIDIPGIHRTFNKIIGYYNPLCGWNKKIVVSEQYDTYSICYPDRLCKNSKIV